MLPVADAAPGMCVINERVARRAQGWSLVPCVAPRIHHDYKPGPQFRPYLFFEVSVCVVFATPVVFRLVDISSGFQHWVHYKHSSKKLVSHLSRELYLLLSDKGG